MTSAAQSETESSELHQTQCWPKVAPTDTGLSGSGPKPGGAQLSSSLPSSSLETEGAQAASDSGSLRTDSSVSDRALQIVYNLINMHQSIQLY